MAQWRRDRLRIGLAARSSVVPVRAEIVIAVRYFERDRNGWIRATTSSWGSNEP